MRIVLLLVLCALPCAAQEGTWELSLDRPGMRPRVSKGTLVLKREGKRWTGTLRFPTILFGRAHELVDLKVSRKRLRFAIRDPRFILAFEGRRKGDVWNGECDWKGLGRYPWTAAGKPAAGEQKRFDEGLSFGGVWKRAGKTDLEIDALIAGAERAGTDALLVVHRGEVVCERYFRGRRGRIHVMSVTKFVTAMAVALLVEEKKKIASLDAPLSTWFPNWKPGAKVTLRHVLAHTSGIHRDRDARGRPNARKLNEAKDKVAYVLGHGLDEEPGTKFEYNNDAIALLSGVITKAAGAPADAYVKEKLFRPLGIEDFAWDRDEAGNTYTYANLQLTARGLARIGMLVADGGGKLFPKTWIAKLGDKPGSKLSEDCGLVWWRLKEPKGYYHTGYLGQCLVILPEEELVAVRLRAWDGSEAPEREFGAFIPLLREALR